jgi:hypothetical protein
MYTSLLSTGDESTANHKLLDTLRQVRAAAQHMHRTRQTGQQCMPCAQPVGFCRRLSGLAAATAPCIMCCTWGAAFGPHRLMQHMTNFCLCCYAYCAVAVQVQTFGLSLMKLDIRQESTRHAEVRRGSLLSTLFTFELYCTCCTR